MAKHRPPQIDATITLTAISVAVGAVVTCVLIYFSQGSVILDITAGLCVTILTLNICELRHRWRVGQRLSTLERAATHDSLYPLFTHLIDYVEEIDIVRSQYPNCCSFVNEKFLEVTTRLHDEMKRLGQGRIQIDNESRELTSNADFLLRLPERTVHAVSYQDATFWDEPEGIQFLDAHKNRINAGIQVTRIFILAENGIDGQRDQILKQAKLGITCFILLEARLEQEYREDFVLYDNRIVRFAQLVATTATNTLKHATLTVEADLVRTYIAKYDYLRARAVEAKEFYSLRQPQP